MAGGRISEQPHVADWFRVSGARPSRSQRSRAASACNLVEIQKSLCRMLAMMRPRSIRVIAIVLAFITGCAALLGWDLAYEERVTDSFVQRSVLEDDLMR